LLKVLVSFNFWFGIGLLPILLPIISRKQGIPNHLSKWLKKIVAGRRCWSFSNMDIKQRLNRKTDFDWEAYSHAGEETRKFRFAGRILG